jgi:ABC-type antimicrobial peptide transport system permease subunit
MHPIVMNRIALRTLGRSKMRTGLTTLGIAIGVAAVLSVVAIGEGAAACAGPAAGLGGLLGGLDVIVEKGTC